jgi:ubiquinone/menaquinone biosynthesis C-methylase UbiE
MKQFDRAYFDKWYRHPKHKVGTAADLRRQVSMAIAATEYMLARPITSVLDVGAGEARWQPIVHELRPKARYIGVDPSEYSVRRYGRRRNLVLGGFDDLDTLFNDDRFDLVVCCSVLNYLPKADAARAFSALARHTGGVAFLEIFATSDDVYGDTSQWYTESAPEYRRMLHKAGFTPCGMHCYVTDALATPTAALERCS